MKRLQPISFFPIFVGLVLLIGIACQSSNSDRRVTPSPVMDKLPSPPTAVEFQLPSTDTTIPIQEITPTTPELTSTPLIINAVDSILDLDAIQSYLQDNGFVVSEISGNDSTLFVTFDSDAHDIFDKTRELEPIELLQEAELLTYLGVYTTFEEFQDTTDISIQIDFQSLPAIHSVINRYDAYDFPPDSFSKPVDQIDPSLLASFAMINHKLSDLGTYEILDQELLDVVINPDLESLELELKDWLSGSDLQSIYLSENETGVIVELNVNFIADLFADADPTLREEELNLEAGLAIVDSFYSLFSRFPWIKNISASVYLRSDLILKYEMPREKFEEIGPQQFNQAAAIGEPERILRLIP